MARSQFVRRLDAAKSLHSLTVTRQGRRYTSPVPISKEMLLFLVDYCAWADRQILAACSALTPEELDRDLNASHTGILPTLRHIYFGQRSWLQRLSANQPPSFAKILEPLSYPDVPPEPSLRQLQQTWPTVSAHLREYVEAASESELSGDFRATDWSISRWKLLLHVVNHSTMHRGQIGNMIRQLRHQPPCTDIFEYNLLQHL
jgi:uncharacterized damage-inducible protein DinB